MQSIPKRNRGPPVRSAFQSYPTPPQSGMYCGAFRISPCVPQPSWTAPVVAPARPGPVTEPSEYRFASRAPVVRRSSPTAAKASTTKYTIPKTAHHGQPSAPSAMGKPSTSSCTYQPVGRQQLDPHTMRHYDSDSQYDEFLASFQHRIDGMTGQRGGWGF